MSTKLCALLGKLDLNTLLPRFEAEGIDDTILPELSELDLQQLGVVRLGDRKRLIKAFSRIAALSGHSLDQDLEVCETNFDAKAPGDIIEFTLPGGIPLKFCYCPAGTFRMGAPFVSISRWFAMGQTPITQEQYQAVMLTNPSHFSGDNLPVENVSWHDAKRFVDYLSHGVKVPGMAFALPTEAQWEYTCRAGTTTAFSCGEHLTAAHANFDESRIARTTPVGSYPANPWNLLDMHGNVWEWCADWHAELQGGIDPRGPEVGVFRAFRGGSWGVSAAGCRSVGRNSSNPGIRNDSIGFRVALVPVGWSDLGKPARASAVPTPAKDPVA